MRQVSWARHRYFLNYCCFGYSLPWWDWDQWEQLIDWMALHGVNMPLAVTGQEAVWQAVCKQLGMSDEEIAAFLAGPPYLPFQWMGCLDGWGGPLPQSWIDRHAELQQKILARQRELGMTPVLQGFTGHVPAAVARKFPDAKLHRIDWIEWQTHLLDPLDPLFPKVARLMIQEQTKRFGTDHLYAADTFIEMTPPSGDLEYLTRLGRAIYSGMIDNDPQAVWVLQGWAFMFKREFWTQPRIEAFLEAVPDDRMVVLDLYCESRPMWNQTQAFCGKPWVWCNIQNFGNTVFLGGALNKIAADLPAARRDAGSGQLVGLGFVNEGLDYNPVVQDLMFEMAWRDEPVDFKAWIVDYARHRYGRETPTPLKPGSGWRRPRTGRRPAITQSSTVRRRWAAEGRGGVQPNAAGRSLAGAAASGGRIEGRGHVSLRPGERRSAGLVQPRLGTAPGSAQSLAGEGRPGAGSRVGPIPAVAGRVGRVAGHAPRVPAGPLAGGRQTLGHDRRRTGQVRMERPPRPDAVGRGAGDRRLRPQAMVRNDRRILSAALGTAFPGTHAMPPAEQTT